MRFIRFISALHTVGDVGFALVGLVFFLHVSRPGRRHHLVWVYPIEISLALVAVFRALVDYHVFFGGGFWSHPMVASVLFYISDVFGVYGYWKFFRLMEQLPPVWVRPGHRPRSPRWSPGQPRRGRRRSRPENSQP